MTRLQEEIAKAIADFRIKENGEWILVEAALEDATIAASEVAKRWITRALQEGVCHGFNQADESDKPVSWEEFKEKYLEENGITE